MPARPEALGQRDPGRKVTARAAAGDEEAAHGNEVPGIKDSSTRISSPGFVTAAQPPAAICTQPFDAPGALSAASGESHPVLVTWNLEPVT